MTTDFTSGVLDEGINLVTPGTSAVETSGLPLVRALGGHPRSSVSGETSRETAPPDSMPVSVMVHWSAIGRAHLSRRTHERIVRLAGLPEGWRGPGSRSMRPDSLKSFLEFWELVRDEAADPSIALAPDGTLHVEWFKPPRQRLDVRFIGRNILFGLLANARVLEGFESAKQVAGILKAHHLRPLTWRA